jgi:lipid-binding SYLF domain-containing protein
MIECLSCFDNQFFKPFKNTVMKTNNPVRLLLFALTLFLLPHTMRAQDEKEKQKLISESNEAKADLIKTDPSMSKLFNDSYGYAMFPKNGKGGLIIGGSGGHGVVYEKGKTIGTAKMAQVTAGAQVGGESYREVIFFENKEALDRFKDNKVEFTSQISAVAAKSGASANAKFADGVVVFTKDLSGLMAEATVGGQKFSYTTL